MALTTITGNMVSVNAIQGTLIADNAITAVHIATNAVSGTLIADNAVTAVHIAQNSITVTQLADDCVESDKIADGIITTNHLNKAMISSQTEVTAATGDFVLLGDTSDSNNLKKTPVSSIVALAGVADGAITSAKLDTNIAIAGTLTTTGEIVANGGIALGDNDKATFGASDDLQIYHTGSHSFVDDAGTGNLYIRGSSIILGKYTGEYGLSCTADGSTDLYYDNALKLATTATGIDVTGTATMDGLTVTAATPSIQMTDSDNNADAYIQATDGNIRFYADDANEAANSIVTFNIDGGEKVRIDSSGSVGIGRVPNANGVLQISVATNENCNLIFSENTDEKWLIGNVYTNDDLRFINMATSSEKMRILSGGGLTFNGDTAAANALDDYEEGTWTPAFYTYSGVTTSSITNNLATYTKIGNIVHIHANIDVTLSSLPGQTVTITGLPFAASNAGATGQRAIIALGGDTANTGAYTPEAHFRTNGSQLEGIRFNASNNTAYWAYAHMDSPTFALHIHGFYTV